MEHPSPQQPNTPTDAFPPPTTPTPTTTPPSDQTTTSTTTPNNTTTTSTPTFSTRRAALNPAFRTKLTQMSLQLAPLVQLTTGAIHPSFPRTLLAFWLLTDDQLDALAHFYHQRTPCQWTRQYPCPVSWPAGLSIEEKRRKLGRFIGLRGCETPIGEVLAGSGIVEVLGRTEEEILEGARRARGEGEGEDGVEEVRRKMGWY
ncbi:hypothetical protein C8A01DRAFT_33877 [Parachaetomium inaequale]|uniref:Uncharacterized protein n=1 Tax=Parachaetomium inaequale TaxID=2588326 RepID=A0AAN6SU36_9PEZI|nr:hypothetical protein C8A01DRAFT_33877 [Parachaetomium inaequale]